MASLISGVLTAIETPAAMPELPLDVRGTAFQEAVWRELRKIPAGETRSYADIAAAVASHAVRAVGTPLLQPVALLALARSSQDGSLGALRRPRRSASARRRGAMCPGSLYLIQAFVLSKLEHDLRHAARSIRRGVPPFERNT